MTHQAAVELIAWHPTGLTIPFNVRADQSVLVGKSGNCGVRLRGHDISDIHCSIGLEDGQLWVQDWTSVSGTKVNGAPVTDKTFVSQGCMLEVGSYKIQVSTPHKATLKPQTGEDCNPGSASTPASEEKSLRHSPSASKPPSAEPAVQSAVPVERSTATTHTQPMVDVDLSTQDVEVYDRETVELLLAEIDDLRAALAQADSQPSALTDSAQENAEDSSDSDRVLSRIHELSEEANQAEERVLLLEEMLHAAEDANRSEAEERTHLEAWVGDIEQRVSQREAEHVAEVKALRERLDSADQANVRLQRQLQSAATDGQCADSRDVDVVEQLQSENRELRRSLEDVTKDMRQLKQKFESQSEGSESALREERAKIAREHADVSRLKYEYAQKIKELEELPMTTAQADPSRQCLLEHRQHLHEMIQERRERQTSQSLSSRLKRIWNMID